MTTEQDFEIVVAAIGNEDMSADELSKAEAALSRIEEGFKGREQAAQELSELYAEAKRQRDALKAELENVGDFLETSSATAARRDEPEMARILSNVSHKVRQALKDLEQA